MYHTDNFVGLIIYTEWLVVRNMAFTAPEGTTSTHRK